MSNDYDKFEDRCGEIAELTSKIYEQWLSVGVECIDPKTGDPTGEHRKPNAAEMAKVNDFLKHNKIGNPYAGKQAPKKTEGQRAAMNKTLEDARESKQVKDIIGSFPIAPKTG